MRRTPKVVRLKKPIVDNEEQFTATLIWLLAEARAGRARGYALVVVVDQPDGSEKLIEAACTAGDEDRHKLLGAMRRQEQMFMRRNWPEDFT